MNLVEMTEYLVKNVVANPDMVTVKEFPSENEKEIVIEVLVDESDIGRVIGKGGKRRFVYLKPEILDLIYLYLGKRKKQSDYLFA